MDIRTLMIIIINTSYNKRDNSYNLWVTPTNIERESFWIGKALGPLKGEIHIRNWSGKLREECGWSSCIESLSFLNYVQ